MLFNCPLTFELLEDRKGLFSVLPQLHKFLNSIKTYHLLILSTPKPPLPVCVIHILSMQHSLNEMNQICNFSLYIHSALLFLLCNWSTPGMSHTMFKANSVQFSHSVLCINVYSIFMTIINLSVQVSLSVVSNSLPPHELQHAKLPCPSQTPRACSNSCPSSQ